MCIKKTEVAAVDTSHSKNDETLSAVISASCISGSEPPKAVVTDYAKSEKHETTEASDTQSQEAFQELPNKKQSVKNVWKKQSSMLC